MIRTMMVCSLRLGVESIEYIYTHLIMEDDPDEEQSLQNVLSLQAMQLKKSQMLQSTNTISPEPGSSAGQPAVN